MMKLRWPPILLALLLTCSFSNAADCPPIEGLEPLLVPGKVLLLGELHGTREAPAFVGDVACHAAEKKLPVVVALELSTAERGRVDAFLDSKGSENDIAALLSGDIWQRDYQDGRNSRAMFELIESVRKLRATGMPATVALFDASGSRGGQHRDRAMGANLAKIVGDSEKALVIALTGNMHSRITRGRSRNADYEPMGYVLSRSVAKDRLVALNMAHGAGTAWICAPKCGVQKLSGRHGQQRRVVEIDEATRPAGHHGWYHVGTMTASRPAREGAEPVKAGSSEPIPDFPVPADAGPVRVDGIAEGPLSADETKFQGKWQSYDYATNSRTWKMEFDGRRFRADDGGDEWYEGWIRVDRAKKPAQLDFVIEDCRCSMKGETSRGIFRYEDDSIVIAAPRPGSRRPGRFNENSGEMLRLDPL